MVDTKIMDIKMADIKMDTTQAIRMDTTTVTTMVMDRSFLRTIPTAHQRLVAVSTNNAMANTTSAAK